MNATKDALRIWTAGVDAVKARGLVAREVKVDGEDLWLGDHCVTLRDWDRLIVVGAGKAGTAMTLGLVDAIGDRMPMVGWVNVPEGTETHVPGIMLHPARPAGVNEPTIAGVEGTRQILRLVGDAGPRDLCMALISGGGSALLPAPISSITLADKVAVTRFLSGAGADITEINLVRKHLSEVKGGGLLRACRAGELVTLILSDILGDPLNLIASGPTVVDGSTRHEALVVLDRFDDRRVLPPSIRASLQAPESSPRPITTKSTTIVLGNNAVAVDEAGICAESLGYNHVMQVATVPEGSAEHVGIGIADVVVQMLRADPTEHRVDCLISGGEPVVRLANASVRGKGGRNQQLVLAAYRRLLECDLTDQEWSRLCILSGGTDGEDGPTDAAGGWIDWRVHCEAKRLSLRVTESLDSNDAYPFLKAARGLLVTGPSGTNVCDVRVAVVRSP